jgi:hypothetical protein
MRKAGIIVLLLCIICDCHTQSLNAVDSTAKPGDPVPYGLTAKQWTRVQKIWIRNNYPVIILLSDSTEVMCQMLWTNDSVVIYWADPHSLINPFQADSLLKTLDVKEISKKFLSIRHNNARLYERGIFWGPLAGAVFSFAYGATSGDFTFFIIPVGIGAIFGSVWDMFMGLIVYQRSDLPDYVNYASLPENNESKYFLFTRDFELIDYTTTSPTLMIPYPDEIGFTDLMKLSPQVKKAFTVPKFSIKFLLTLSQSLDTYDFGLGYSAGYKLSEKFAIGYSYRYTRADFNTDMAGHPFYESLTKKSNHIYLNYYAGPLNWLLTTPRFKAYVGADVSLNKIYYHRSILYSGPEYNVEKHFPGFGLAAGFEIYPVRNQSLGISAFQSLTKPLQVDGLTIRTSSFGIFLSIGYHFRIQ